MESLESRRLMAVFSVTSVDDSGEGTLRQAILDANLAPGADSIEFAIDGDGVHTIRPTTALPIVSGPTAIDGSTQHGYAGTPLIEIDGSAVVGVQLAGISLQGGNSLVRGLTINRFTGVSNVGIELTGPGGNRVEGCYIGVTADGTAAAGMRYAGIEIFQSPDNTIGGTTSAARNVIASNSVDIVVGGGSETGNVIQGNYVGLDVTGTTYLGAINTGGIGVLNPGTLIGGTEPGAGNVIVGGLGISGGTQPIGPVGTIVQGNLIGTDATGTRILGFVGQGLAVSQTDHVTIGGTAAGAGNVIAGNGTGNNASGIYIAFATDVVVQGNFIGTDRSETLDLGNGGDGIAINSEADHITIGGTVAGAGNVIAHNGFGPYHLSGVNSWAGNHVTIVGNRIFGNNRLNIDVGPNGRNPNDFLDLDDGPNGLLNYPVIADAGTSGGRLQIFGSYDGAPNTSLTLDFYAAATQGANDADAETVLGRTRITTDADGHADYLFEALSTVPAGWFVTATATDDAGSTSEFALPVVVAAGALDGGPASSISFDQAGTTVDEAAGYARIRVVRTGSTGVVSVSYATDDGSAQAGSDYTATSGTLVFGPGETTKTIIVPITADTVSEANETVGLALSDPAHGATLGQLSTATVTIVNNDAPPPASTDSANFVVSGVRVLESAGTVVLQVVRTGGTDPFQVSYQTENGTARLGLDYIGGSGTLTFGAGETVKTISIPLYNNSNPSLNRIFAVRLTDPADSGTHTDPRLVSVTIIDDDRPRAAGAGADYDGDGKTDLLLFRASDNDRWLGSLSSDGSLYDVHFGDPAHGDVPAPGDYDGDGRSDLAVFRPSQAVWIIRFSGGGTRILLMGDPAAGDIAAPGDYNGDGTTDLAVFRPSTATWIIRFSSGDVKVEPMGDPTQGDVAVPGDYDGDGRSDLAVYRPSTATWIARLSGGGVMVTAMGDASQHDLPMPGDYDGDSITDLAVFRPSSATWILRQSGGTVRIFRKGEPNLIDVPVTVPMADLPGAGRMVRSFGSAAVPLASAEHAGAAAPAVAAPQPTNPPVLAPPPRRAVAQAGPRLYNSLALSDPS